MKSSRKQRGKTQPRELTYRERAEQQLEFWRELLRLQDWDIELEFARAFDIAKGGLGSAQIRIQEQAAVITLREPDDIGPSAFETDRDLELTLVHELIHLKTYAAIESQSETEIEKMVEGLSRIFVRLLRGEYGTPPVRREGA